MVDPSKLDDPEREHRLFHTADYRIGHVTFDVNNENVACSVYGKEGHANIARIRNDGTGLVELTEGDSVDIAPAWSPAGDQSLVYQSAGIGRSRDGYAMGLGPFRAAFDFVLAVGAHGGRCASGGRSPRRRLRRRGGRRGGLLQR